MAVPFGWVRRIDVIDVSEGSAAARRGAWGGRPMSQAGGDRPRRGLGPRPRRETIGHARRTESTSAATPEPAFLHRGRRHPHRDRVDRSGAPLLRCAHWLSHVEHDLHSPVWRPWLAELSRDHQYIRYDQRGCGLSDSAVTDFSLDAWVGDLEAVVERPGPAPLSADRHVARRRGGHRLRGAPPRQGLAPHPARRLRARRAAARAGDAQRLEAETLVNLIRLGWGRDNAAFRQVFTNQFIPGGSPTQHQWWNELERLTASPENAARTLEAFHRIDVTELARQAQVPTLVLHARGDARVPFDEGLRLAALIPGARFVPLNSDNHVLLDTEPAWAPFLAELRAFLGTGPADARPPPGDGDGDGGADTGRTRGAAPRRHRPGQPCHRPAPAQERKDGAQPAVEHSRQAGRAHARRSDRVRARQNRTGPLRSIDEDAGPGCTRESLAQGSL
jgi:pimeloyl-ACP methyl ester carboxylesterase